MSHVEQRSVWSGRPVKGGGLWRLTKTKGDVEHVAVCELWSQQFGWELRLLVNDDLQQSQVCRTFPEWTDTAAGWKASMVKKGWR